MQAYHYTDLNAFRSILADEALLSHCARLARELAATKGGTFEEHLKRLEGEPNRSDYKREISVYLSHEPDRSTIEGVVSEAQTKFEMVVIGFEFPDSVNKEDPNCGYVRVSPRLSLEYMTEVYAQKPVLHEVKRLLKTSHGGKYKKTPVKEWKPAKP